VFHDCSKAIDPRGCKKQDHSSQEGIAKRHLLTFTCIKIM